MYHKARTLSRNRYGVTNHENPELRSYNRLLLGNCIDHRLAHLQVLVHQKMWRMGHPFSERDVFIMVALEHFQKDQIGVADIFDIVRLRLRNVTHIAFLKIHGAGAAARGEHRHAAFAADVVLPFIGVWMPVQFTQAFGL